MEALMNYDAIIKQVLMSYTEVPYSHGDLICQPIFDDINDHYLLMTLGWDRNTRVHGCLVHIDVIDNKVWVQRDETEDGIARELVAAGIPKSRIVLGFKPIDMRPYTDYAIA
jgi:hypothetical protein